MRISKPRKAPEIDVLARHFMQKGLRKHAEAGQHVSNVDDIKSMPLLKLLNLAKAMGLDANAVIEKTEAADDELSEYSMRHPAFRGELEFDLTIAFLGKGVTRK